MAVKNKPEKLNFCEHCLSIFTRIRPGEGWAVMLFSMYAMVLMLCYYVFKTMRETLILTSFSAEVRSYAMAAIALVLFFIIPLYGMLFRCTRKVQLIQWITFFFSSNIIIFYFMGRAGMELGFVYYVWVGVYGVMMIAQFWAFAADCFSVNSGQRLFPVIMAGQALGAVIGTQMFSFLLPFMGPFNVLLVAGILLAATTIFVSAAYRLIPAESAAVYADDTETECSQFDHFMGGLAVVMRSRYLVLIAVVAVLLNWINSTGEFIFADFVSTRAAAGGEQEKSGIIAALYGDYFTATTILGFIIQVFLVSRIYRWIGISGALLILPVIAMLGYGMVVFLPIFSLIWLVKIIENAADYSIMNTTRQAIYLPLTQIEKYEGKTAIDTFFWRVGDLVQAGAIYAGLNWFGFSITQFALVNMGLAAVWIWLAVLIGRRYRNMAAANQANGPPMVNRPIPDVHAPAGSILRHVLADDHFTNPDPNDVFRLSACQSDGNELPEWLAFDAIYRTFYGQVPEHIGPTSHIELTATDSEGSSVSTRFYFHHSKQGHALNKQSRRKRTGY